ncbi:hypothetical protein NCAS_0J00300 [Naumovozyma castellii]|uniref:Enoyl reductase (ER) domain-containing protein n=1 Tax=Naumovozyma castellii TaxID=27288 RepID=G0VKH6_NAUCA|nr:hypothetical protein NCAS_0J00300 [Naumovozyma castellii CBS 4309]CCC72010.1 hypothetical protein NCAS_0J00300 [Naumovozyma castellii CBS 4309]
MPSQTQTAVILQKKGLIEFGEKPIPALTDEHWVKVQIKATGICGSDVHFYKYGSIGDFVVKSPMVLGHESSGIIAEVGSAVKTLKVGDRVALEPGYPSRYTEATMSGHYNLCPFMHFAATPPCDGTLTKYYLTPFDFVYKLPDNVSYEEGALLEPLSVGVHANKQAGTRFGDKVVVFGAGPVGLLNGAVAKVFGALQVVFIDVVDEKLERAKHFGATAVINSSKLRINDEFELAVAIKEKLGGVDPDIVLECTGAEPCIRAGIRALKTGGTFVQVGMGKDDANIPITQFSCREITLKGCFRYCHGDYQNALDLVATGKIPVKLLVTRRFTFDEAVKAYMFNAEHAEEVVKSIISGPE